MKKIICLMFIIATICFSCNNNRNKQENADKPKTENIEEPIFAQNINTNFFEKNIYDFRNETEWKYKGNKPAIIDFYAKWCGPCKQMAPILDELANDYKGKIEIYKIDTDQEQELSYYFGIQSIPCLMFIPMNANPEMIVGYNSKQFLVEQIENRLLK